MFWYLLHKDIILSCLYPLTLEYGKSIIFMNTITSNLVKNESTLLYNNNELFPVQVVSLKI